MNNFNTNLYETKREIINYSNKITGGLKKPTAKIYYGYVIWSIEESKCNA